MEKSASTRTPEGFAAPRWALFVPIAVSGAVTISDLLGDPCRGPRGLCNDVWGALSWVSVVFPNVLAIPAIFTGIPKAALVLSIVAANAMFALLLWRTQPVRLGMLRLTAILAVWTLLSALTTWYSPDLMKLLYDVFH